mmetsp:Transcript_25653/g.70596  ORF Transcript_25653/g.70596 Transcript_25653/m.70596 type:complete len:357 (+) Transcript_25653:105-1175(+)
MKWLFFPYFTSKRNNTMAPLCIEEDNNFYCSEEESSTTSTTTSSTSSISSSSSDESSASPLKTPRARRSVSFSAGAAVHVGAVMNVEDYSDAEKIECWYQADEMREIRKDVKDTIALMNQNLALDQALVDVTMTTRGLEGKTRAGKRYRREVRLASLAAVFDEQALQEMDGVTDPVMISMAYTEHAQPMQVAAFERASVFQREADGIYKASFDALDYSHDEFDKTSAIVETTESNRDVGAPMETTKSDFDESQSTQPVEELLEIEEVVEKDDNDATNAADEMNARDDVASSEETENICDNQNFEETNDSHTEPEHNTNLHPYNIGPMRIRDRFACLLPGSHNRRNALIGTLRVVHI